MKLSPCWFISIRKQDQFFHRFDGSKFFDFSESDNYNVYNVFWCFHFGRLYCIRLSWAKIVQNELQSTFLQLSYDFLLNKTYSYNRLNTCVTSRNIFQKRGYKSVTTGLILKFNIILLNYTSKVLFGSFSWKNLDLPSSLKTMKNWISKTFKFNKAFQWWIMNNSLSKLRISHDNLLRCLIWTD